MSTHKPPVIKRPIRLQNSSTKVIYRATPKRGKGERVRGKGKDKELFPTMYKAPVFKYEE